MCVLRKRYEFDSLEIPVHIYRKNKKNLKIILYERIAMATLERECKNTHAYT